jgi:hypothetical protein
MATSSIRTEMRSHTSALLALANDLVADADPVNQAVGRKILGCLHCNLSGVNKRCDTCPLALAHLAQQEEVSYALAA